MAHWLLAGPLQPLFRRDIAAMLKASLLARALDEEKVQTRAGLPESLHGCVLGIAVPGARMVHRRKFNHGDVCDVWSGSFKYFPGIRRTRNIPSAVPRDQLVHYLSIRCAP